MVLENLGRSLDSLIRKIRNLPEVDKDAINGILQELQRALLMSDVKVDICLEVTDRIRRRAMDEKIKENINRRDYIITILHDELINILGGEEASNRIKTGHETLTMLVGIQGSGKTTTVAKLALYYKNKGYRVGAICTDTWRPGAYDQLSQLLDSIGVQHFGIPDEKNPMKIARKGLKEFEKAKNKPDLIIIDTAGRHKEETALMEEMQKLEETIKPNEILLVIDGTLGQQAYNQAKAFAESTHIGSIIITKLDGSAKGGGALSAAAAAHAPIKFIGVGEKIEDFEIFVPTKFVGYLMGVPDIEGLIRDIKEKGIEPDEDQISRMKHGKSTLDDMYQQLVTLQNLGGFKKLIEKMIPSRDIPDEVKSMAEGNMDRIQIIIQSCTPGERKNPDMIRKTRISRIAQGSGTSYTEVKQVLNQWEQMNNWMKKMTNPKKRGKKRGSGMPGMEGMDAGAFPGGIPSGFDMSKMQQMMTQGGKVKRKKHPW